MGGNSKIKLIKDMKITFLRILIFLYIVKYKSKNNSGQYIGVSLVKSNPLSLILITVFAIFIFFSEGIKGIIETYKNNYN